ncbi:MAG: hypothetical protein LUD47_03085 [Clostridia bacterium]|nr:hypothetical protein [Clostridia bacterium]
MMFTAYSARRAAATKPPSFRMKNKSYTAPGGEYPRLYDDMLHQSHLLIAGATGSGKSVLINGLIHAALFRHPGEGENRANFILIDPKRTELIDFAELPHTILYASEPDEIPGALQKAMDITEDRFKRMQKDRVKKYSGGDVYIIIDELADLMTTQKKMVVPLLQRLCQLGRAANVHVIAATQCPLVEIIPTKIKVNFDARVGLRTSCKQDSRNILGFTGCEELPRYGYGYYMRPEDTELYEIPYTSEEEIEEQIKWWMNQM